MSSSGDDSIFKQAFKSPNGPVHGFFGVQKYQIQSVTPDHLGVLSIFTLNHRRPGNKAGLRVKVKISYYLKIYGVVKKSHLIEWEPGFLGELGRYSQVRTKFPWQLFTEIHFCLILPCFN